jgi:hypothetical protein
MGQHDSQIEAYRTDHGYVYGHVFTSRARIYLKSQNGYYTGTLLSGEN